jgi:ATPase subunit of ABC transporter with duplicated ATPase domains
MANLHLHNLSYQHDDGREQFRDLDLVLPRGRTALIGNNGIGKSLLVQLIAGELQASSGKIERSGVLHIFKQSSYSTMDCETVADVFGVSDKLKALDLISSLSADASARSEEEYNRAFEVIDDDWLVEERINTLLEDVFTLTLRSSVAHLSGGERARLQLFALFNSLVNDSHKSGEQGASSSDILILDEPSNHLDADGKLWLMEQLDRVSCDCILISHDKALLDTCENVAELTSKEIRLFSGSFDSYREQRQQQLSALQNTISQLQRQRSNVAKQAQRDKEKAEKRAARGNRKASSGGLPSIVANARGAKSQASAAKGKAKHDSKRESLAESLATVQTNSLATEAKSIHFDFANNSDKKRCLLNVEGFRAQYMRKGLTLKVHQGEKWHLQGRNGSGKSSFLKAICTPQNSIYIDQDCSLIQAQHTLLENLNNHLDTATETELRTLLAGNGFRGERVNDLAGMLSGGEKMRLAMLIAGSSPEKLLLLDEPDNHLDLASKELLAQALSDFNGSFILISHDEYFVSGCGIEHVCDQLL